jgi:hypothetical protein
MTPAETIVLRGDTDEQTEDWYDVIFAAAITARALSLGRPVLPTEFFGMFFYSVDHQQW